MDKLALWVCLRCKQPTTLTDNTPASNCSTGISQKEKVIKMKVANLMDRIMVMFCSLRLTPLTRSRRIEEGKSVDRQIVPLIVKKMHITKRSKMKNQRKDIEQPMKYGPSKMQTKTHITSYNS